MTNLVMDKAGTMFGCSAAGVYRLDPPETGAAAGQDWTETMLAPFTSAAFPDYACGVGIDPATDTMLVAVDGGPGSGFGGYGPMFGALVSVKPAAPGGWVMRVQHAFHGAVRDGGKPEAAPFFLNGTFYGGNFQNGSIYALTE